jgi:hypothetical protein
MKVQGTPISYVYNDNGRLLQDTFSNSALIFLLLKVKLTVNTTGGLTAQQQWEVNALMKE